MVLSGVKIVKRYLMVGSFCILVTLMVLLLSLHGSKSSLDHNTENDIQNLIKNKKTLIFLEELCNSSKDNISIQVKNDKIEYTSKNEKKLSKEDEEELFYFLKVIGCINMYTYQKENKNVLHISFENIHLNTGDVYAKMVEYCKDIDLQGEEFMKGWYYQVLPYT